MFKKVLFALLLSASLFTSYSQAPRGITQEEYAKAKTFVIKDLDNDSYVKFDNTYVLDRYEGRKPYFITGDDGLRKRIDLYALSLRADGTPLGTVIYYTNEKGKLYVSCLPNNFADGKVWERYFEDIHAIDKEEKFYVLKLSYVLSKEFSFQQYKSSLKGKEPDRAGPGTYGTEICFPGQETVAMAGGVKKLLSDIRPGDEVLTVDPATHLQTVVKVKGLVEHEAKNYAITRLTLFAAREKASAAFPEIVLTTQELEATPNHPVMTQRGIKNIGAVTEGEEILCLDEKTGRYEAFRVWDKSEKAHGVQKVYNIEAEGGRTFIISGVMVMQKQQGQ